MSGQSVSVPVAALLVVLIMVGVCSVYLLGTVMSGDNEYDFSQGYASEDGSYYSPEDGVSYTVTGTGNCDYKNESDDSPIYQFSFDMTYADADGNKALHAEHGLIFDGDTEQPVSDIYESGGTTVRDGEELTVWHSDSKGYSFTFYVGSGCHVPYVEISYQRDGYQMLGVTMKAA